MSLLKLPRTIRLDPSDTFVFDPAAEPGEWAVSGAFLFAGDAAEDLPPKMRNAFRSGFLGIGSFGWSTLVVVTAVTAIEHKAAEQMLAESLIRRFAPPDPAQAWEAAREELAFAASLCDHPVNTLIAVQRAQDEDGEVHERFRTLHQREATPGADALHAHARVFQIVEFDDDGDAPQERVDLSDLARKGRPS